MIRAALVVALVACGGGPKPPDPARYQAMTDEERCEATAPRATKCTDELMAAEVRALATALGSDADAMAATFKSDGTPGESEALTIHQLQCTTAETYPDAVVACWGESGCDAFARCVVGKEQELGGLFRRPDPAQMKTKEAACKATQRRRERCARALGEAFAAKQPPPADMKIDDGERERKIVVEEAPLGEAELCAIDGVNEAIAACWDIGPCNELAACVRGKVPAH